MTENDDLWEELKALAKPRVPRKKRAKKKRKRLRCSGRKTTWPGKGEARNACSAILRASKEKMHPFYCPDCVGWHIGHGTKRAKR